MANKQSSRPQFGLERMCRGSRTPLDRIFHAPSVAGLNRVEAFFSARAYAPHRHDTYAIGFTAYGVQSFDYRGVAWQSLPGQVFVLHPDELHDGRAGTESGYGHRTLYLDPALVREALGGRALPFVRAPVTDDPEMRSAVGGILSDIGDPIDDLCRADMVLSLASALEVVSGGMPIRVSVDQKAVEKARDLLIAGAARNISISELEAASGQDRWTLARQFRAAFGVSPHRFLIHRRLDRACLLIRDGVALAEAAYLAGFSDQSHMSRHFKGVFGVPPGVWRSLAHGLVNPTSRLGKRAP